MTESVVPSKMKQWMRTLIGGVLSAAVAGFTILFALRVAPNPITLFLAAAFSLPTYFVQIVSSIFTHDPHAGETLPVFSISLLFWLMAGSTISYLVKTNKAAIKVWLWLYAGMLLLSLLNFVVRFFLPV
ncbi:MAG TPA: hypothetical protein VK206_18300 [Anaerolineales bacterium]|nr:hypothetical protein [Anaerolineales bacterium]